MMSLPRRIRIKLAARLFEAIAARHARMEEDDNAPMLTETIEQFEVCTNLRVSYEDAFAEWTAPCGQPSEPVNEIAWGEATAARWGVRA